MHGWPAIGLLVCTFAALLWVATNEVRSKQAEKRRREADAVREGEIGEVKELAKTGM